MPSLRLDSKLKIPPPIRRRATIVGEVKTFADRDGKVFSPCESRMEWFVSSVLGGMVALIFVWFFSWEIGELIAECRKILGK